MSAALLRKALEIVEADPKLQGQGKKKSKGVFDLIPANHRNIKTVGKGGKIEKRAVYNIGDRSSKKNKKPYKNPNSTLEENLKKLSALATSSIKEDIAEKIVKRARTGKPLIEVEEEKEDEGTVFTEEDFRKFENDPFCS